MVGIGMWELVIIAAIFLAVVALVGGIILAVYLHAKRKTSMPLPAYGCPQCGQRLTGQMKFCPQCGKQIA